jgi:hypothetical protein
MGLSLAIFAKDNCRYIHILAVIKPKGGALRIVEKYGSREKQYGDFGWNSTGKRKAIGGDAFDRIIRWLVEA